MPQTTKGKTTKKDVKKTTPATRNEITETQRNEGKAGPERGDPKALAQLAIIEPRVATMEANDAKGRRALGAVLLPVRRNKWYRAKGFRSFEQYCEEVLGIAKRTALELTDAADAFTEEQYVKFGESRAGLGLLLLKATPEHDTANDLETSTLRFGSGKGKTFLDATMREIREDIAGERGKPAIPPKKPAAPTPPPPAPEQSGKDIPKQYKDLPKVMESVFPGAHVVVYSVPSKSGKGSEVRFDIRGLKADDYTGGVTGLKNLLKLDGKHDKGVRQ